ncbi:O-antigen ligase family protein, partial [Singulisphaera rosea]
VALMLWVSVALGLNLREDRPCGQLRDVGGRLPAFGVSMVWSAVIGSYFGAIFPVWGANQEIADAESALRARPPQFERAENAYVRAYTLDRFSSRPWFGLAFSKFEEWRARGSKVDDRRWKAIPVALADAVKAPRNPNSWALHHQRALVIRDLLAKLGPQLSAKEVLTYRSNIIADTRRASILYPSNATLHAELSQASAEIGMMGDAVTEAKEALRLDKLLAAHRDKRLSPALRKFLEDQLPKWEKDARGAISAGALPKS